MDPKQYTLKYAQFTKLMATASTVLHVRRPEMVEELLSALRLFNKNRLAQVTPLSMKRTERVSNKTLLARRREVLKGQIAQYGIARVTIEFYAGLSTRTRNVCTYLNNLEGERPARPNGTHTPLRELVTCSEETILRFRNSGKRVLGELELALNSIGLKLNMTEDEVYECFGRLDT